MSPQVEVFQDILTKIQERLRFNIEDDEQTLQREVQNILDNEYSHLSTQKRIFAEFFGLGPLESLLQDQELNEIMINSHKEIWVEKNGNTVLHDDCFFSEFSYKNIVERFCQIAKLNYSVEKPYCDGHYQSFRVHLIFPPLTQTFPQWTLRRHRQKCFTLNELQEAQWAKPEQIQILRELMYNKANILVIGPTGSGKTSTINSCLAEVNESERVVVLEDTSEIELPNSISTKLITRSSAESNLLDFNLSDLLRQSLRMRPQRIVVGEVRGAEAKDLLMALATGHSGGLCSLHAQDPMQALLRLEMLVQLGAPQWNPKLVRHLIFLSLQNIVNVEFKNGKRRLEGLYRLCSLENNGITIERL